MLKFANIMLILDAQTISLYINMLKRRQPLFVTIIFV